LDLYKKQDANITRIEFQISERVEAKSNNKSNVIDFEKKDLQFKIVVVMDFQKLMKD